MKSPTSNLPTTASHSYFPALDGLRAVAFLLVFGLHYLGTELHLLFGWVGVDIFFVLSGFLITGILYDGADSPHRYFNFYIRRTLRIFPLYYGIFLLLLLLSVLCRWDWNWTWLAWPLYIGNFTVLSAPPIPLHSWVGGGLLVSTRFPNLWLNIGHFWSLCVEEQFYLVWPFIVFSIRNRRALIGFCTAVAVAIPLLRIFAEHFVSASALRADALNYVTFFRCDALVIGAIIALLRRGPARDRLPSYARVGLVVFTILGAAFLGFRHLHHLPNDSPFHISMKFVFADLLAACVILLVIQPGSLFYRTLNVAPLRWLGRISYGAYVFHEIIQPWLVNVVPHYFKHPRVPEAVIAFLFTIVVAYCSFRWFETPFIKLKNRYTKTNDAPREVPGFQLT